MIVVHLSEPEKVDVVDLPVRREPDAGEVLIEPILVGIAGIDAQRFRKGAPVVGGFRKPHIPGNEFVGRVVSLGRGVEPTLLGARVVGDPVSPCMKCQWCLQGIEHLCPSARLLGVPPVSGAMQQRFSWPAHLCKVISNDVPDEIAALMVPLSLAVHVVDSAGVELMDDVVVIGCGPVGLLTIKCLRASGVHRILAIDPVEYRRKAALDFGATEACEPFTADEPQKKLKRGGYDVAIEVSNISTGSREAVQLTRIGGRAILAGIPDDDRVLFSATEARRKELHVQFVKRPHNTLWRAQRLVEDGYLDGLERLVTHEFTLDDATQAFRTVRRMEDEVLKAVIRIPSAGAAK